MRYHHCAALLLSQWRGRSASCLHAGAAPQLHMSAALPTVSDLEDPRIWLEEVQGDDALAWVRERNAATLGVFGEPSAQPEYKRILDILASDDQIPYVGRVLNGLYYNFWTDKTHVRGIWRRCSPEEYRKPSPNWETVLDVDQLGADEGVSWVWAGSTVLDEGPETRKERVMIRLSRGGADAKVAREFDLDKKAFIPESEGGFMLPEAKSQLTYKGRDTLLVGGVFGEADMTDSGYPRSVYEWQRGTPLASATKVYEGEATDVSVSGLAYLDRGERYEMRYRSLTFYTASYELMRSDGTFASVPVPKDAQIGTFADQLLITLRSPWLGYAAGSLLACPVRAFMAAAPTADVARQSMMTELFIPTESCSLEATTETRNYVILSALDDVVTELRFWKYDKGSWALERTFKEEGLLSPSVSAVSPDSSDAIFITASGYTQPTTLSLAEAASPQRQEPLKALPAFYDTAGLTTTQYFATSADGTRVPYFLVARADVPLDGSTPTLLYGYGGFEVTLTPSDSLRLSASLSASLIASGDFDAELLGERRRGVAREGLRVLPGQHPRRR